VALKIYLANLSQEWSREQKILGVRLVRALLELLGQTNRSWPESLQCRQLQFIALPT